MASSTDLTPAPLPHLLRELADAAGYDVACQFATRHGGRRFYVPKWPSANLIDLLGTVGAEWLRTNYGGTSIAVPIGPNTRSRHVAREVARMTSEGQTVSVIAAKLGISDRTVQYHRARLREA